jgi:hypothetical protein
MPRPLLFRSTEPQHLASFLDDGHGATAFSLMTLSITTLGIRTHIRAQHCSKNVAFGIPEKSSNNCHNSAHLVMCYSAERNHSE